MNRPRPRFPVADFSTWRPRRNGSKMNGRTSAGDRLALIADLHHDLLAVRAGEDRHARSARGVLDRVAGEIREHLREAVRIPAAREIALRREVDGRIEFFGDVLQDRAQVHRRSRDRQAAAEPGSRELQELRDHLRHAVIAPHDPRDRLCDRARRGARDFQHHSRREADRSEWRAQIVPEDADEELPKLRDLAARVAANRP